jgi:O-antigen/teichoic acid export membrane protein
MLRLLILAWLLSPDDFGLLAIATTAIGFLLHVTDIGMIPALVQGDEIEEKHYNAAWTVGISRTLAITLLTILAAPFIAQLFAEPRAVPIIQVLAIRPLLEALSSIKVAKLTRQLQFQPLAILKLVEAVVTTVVSIALAKSYGVWALVVGTLAGSFSYLFVSYLVAPHRPQVSFHWTVAKSLIRFGRWVFLTGLIVMAGNYVLRIVISRQLGTVELGLYFLAAQLAFLPAEAASEVVGTVAFPLFARLQNDLQQATRIFQMVLSGLAILLFPICALLIVLAPTLVQEVLGTRWTGTVQVIQVLALVSMIGIFGEVTLPIFNGFGKPYNVTIIEIVQSTSVIALVWSLTSFFGLVGAALAWLPTAIVSQTVSAILIRRLLPQPLVGLPRRLLTITTVTGLSALVAFSVDQLVPGLAGLILAITLGLLVFAGLLWILDYRLKIGLLDDLNRVFPQLSGLVGYSRRILSRV